MSFETSNPSTSKEEKMSEYEKNVRENIQELHMMFSGVFENVKQSVEELAKSSSRNNGEKKRGQNVQNWRQVKMGSSKPGKSTDDVKVEVRRSTRVGKKINYNESGDNGDNNKNKRRQGTLFVKFPWVKEQNRDNHYLFSDSDFIDSDGDEPERNRPLSKRPRVTTAVRVAVSQVTKDMLDNIVYSSKKTYDASGTSCHQCRQKTSDQKSYCRYKGCKGVRGMFCGYCLRIRYGEDVADALKNPKWACPPCRGHCNCSICRRKLGLQPTGQLAQQAASGGYKSVRHMLCDIENEGADQTEDIADTEETERSVEGEEDTTEKTEGYERETNNVKE